MRASLAVALLFACAEPRGGSPVDGGGFVLPDAGPRPDAGDAGAVEDAGAECKPTCVGNDFCRCTASGCACLGPGQVGDFCDRARPETCAAGRCVEARIEEGRVDLCSDGTETSPCSRDSADVCTTKLGCVCLTNIDTVCTCIEKMAPGQALCDRQVPASCAGTCVRQEVSGGVRFVCSDGSEGMPCEAGDNSCTTSLGCTCPRIRGVDVCSCSEPGAEGEACDINVSGSCVAPFECLPRGTGGQISSVCGRGGAPDGGVVMGCDPNDPSSCPLGQMCVQQGPRGVCR